MGKDTGDVHTWQEDYPSFEVGVTRDCREVLSVYLHTSGRLRNLANNRQVVLARAICCRGDATGLIPQKRSYPLGLIQIDSCDLHNN